MPQKMGTPTVSGQWGNYATISPMLGRNWLFLAEGSYSDAAPTVALQNSSVSVFTDSNLTTSRSSTLDGLSGPR
jgi:hypothetical protein